MRLSGWQLRRHGRHPLPRGPFKNSGRYCMKASIRADLAS